MPHPVSTHPPIAVVGLHGRFPSAPDLRGFWDNLAGGRDVIGHVPSDRWVWEDLFEEPGEAAHPTGPDRTHADRTYANQGGFMPFVDRFDHRLFGILPREAQTMDPQQRLFLQTAWAALEDAGHPPGTLAGGKVGVFVGVGHADYPGMMRRAGVPLDIYRGTGIALTAVANRVSFLFDFHGPSEIVDTACSSSLVAIHRAVRSIHAGDCDMAIAGGINLLLAPELFIAFAKAGMLSRSGRCRTFDAAADGYVRGEGVGALVLRPLDAAERDGDFIYGVIRGSAENHGGRAHSFTAPNVKAQADVVREAWRTAGLPLRRAALIETHGTGTPLGDPIEINGLTMALQDGSGDGDTGDGSTAPIALGALKTHIGHLEAAAGIAAVIRALLAMQHGTVPGNLHHTTLNPHIRLDGTPFLIPTGNMPLDPGGSPVPHLFAGVSSFGFGGVNAHVVLQSHRPALDAAEPDRDGRPYLFVLSAKDGKSLSARVHQLMAFLAEAEATGVPDGALPMALAAALDLPASVVRRADGMPLAALGVTPDRFAQALRAAGAALGRTIGLADVRDCVTLQEIAHRLATPPAAPDAETEHLRCRVALTPEQVAAATPARIAYSLMHGRDALPERLAVVAGSRRALLDILSCYLADPTSPDPASSERAWVRGSARRDARPAPTGRIGSDWPDEEALLAWAAHWVHTKGAALTWAALYGDGAVPMRVPLPSYPFRLDRVWYVPGAARPAHAPEGPGSAMAGLRESWTGAWSASPLRPPPSVAALALALEHGLSATEESRLRLTDAAFGPPAGWAACRVTRNRSTIEVHSLDDGMPVRVLFQARLTDAAAAPAIAQPLAHPLEVLDRDAVYAAASAGGLAPAQAMRRVDRFERGPGTLVAHLRLAWRQAGDGVFWTTLLATALLGVRHLQGAGQGGGGSGALLLPWRIATAEFDAEAARDLRRLAIRFDGAGRPATILAYGKDDVPALVLGGVVLRAAPEAERAVAMPLPGAAE